MRPILIVAAVEQEIALLIRVLGCLRSDEGGFPAVYAGQLGDRQVIVAAAGIGKINAASVTSALVVRWQPDLIISTGCAGAFPGAGLAIGDLALAVSELLGDEGVLTPAGWQDLETIGIPLLELKGERYFNEIPLSFSVAERAVQLAAALDIKLKRSRFLTVSTCSGTNQRGSELYERFTPACESMEGAAVALVALQYGVDCLEIRGISNMVEDRDLSRWNIQLAVEQAQRFLLKFLEGY